MTTRTMERARTKCGQYWPELEGKEITLHRAEIIRGLQGPVCSAACSV